MDGTAILIIILFVLLIISTIRRKSAQWTNEDLEKELSASKQINKYAEVAKEKLNAEIIQVNKDANNEREKFKIEINKNQNQIENYKKNEIQITNQLSDLKVKFIRTITSLKRKS